MITINACNPINTRIQSNFSENKNTCKKLEISNNDKFIKKNHRNPSFLGLSNKLKDGFYSKSTVEELIKKYPKSNGWVGSIPKEWEDKIKIRFDLPRKEHSKLIKNFYNGMGNIAIELRDSGQFDKNVQQAMQQINQLFRKVGITSEKEELCLYKIGEGSYGNTYQLGVQDDPNQYVIKLFHKIISEVPDDGNPIEANGGLFLRTIAKEPNISNGNDANNCQISIFSFADTNAGYTLMQHIGDEKKSPKELINFKLLGITHVDASLIGIGRNCKSGYIIDHGGLKLYNDLLAQNKTVRNVLEMIYNKNAEKRIELWDDIFLHKLYGNKNHVLLGLAESLQYIKPEDALCRFKKLSVYSDQTLKKTLCNYLDIFPLTERVLYFDTLLDNADNNVKAILASKLYTLPEKIRYLYFEKLLEGAENDLKKTLVNSLFYLKENESYMGYTKLLDAADQELKCFLADRFYHVPKSEAYNTFIKLLDGDDNNIKKILVNKIYSLPKDKQVDCFEMILQAADTDVKINLAKILYTLPEGNIFELFEKLAKNSNNDLKKALVDTINYLPEIKRADGFKLLLEGADDEVKKLLTLNLNYILEKDRQECIIQLYNGASNNLMALLNVLTC